MLPKTSLPTFLAFDGKRSAAINLLSMKHRTRFGAAIAAASTHMSTNGLHQGASICI